MERCKPFSITATVKPGSFKNLRPPHIEEKLQFSLATELTESRAIAYVRAFQWHRNLPSANEPRHIILADGIKPPAGRQNC